MISTSTYFSLECNFLSLSIFLEQGVFHEMRTVGDYMIWNKIHWIILIAGHPRLEPRSFPEEDIATSFDKDYMFMGCIKFIHKVIEEHFLIYLCVFWPLEYSFVIFFPIHVYK